MTDILDTLDELEDGELDDNEVLDGEIVELDDEFDLDDYEMGETQAREITEAIKSAATATYILLAEAHAHKAHKAMGYDTWAEYIKSEFDMSAQRSYQLIDLSKAVAMIEAATPEGTQIKLTEAQARDIKRELPKITQQIEEETSDMTAEEAAARAAEIVNEYREEANAQKDAEDRVATERRERNEDEELEDYYATLEETANELLEADRPDGITSNADDGLIEVSVEGDGDVSTEVTMHRFNFFNILATVDGLPEPDEFVDMIPDARAEEISEQILSVTAWFNRLQTLWELRNEE